MNEGILKNFQTYKRLETPQKRTINTAFLGCCSLLALSVNSAVERWGISQQEQENAHLILKVISTGFDACFFVLFHEMVKEKGGYKNLFTSSPIKKPIPDTEKNEPIQNANFYPKNTEEGGGTEVKKQEQNQAPKIVFLGEIEKQLMFLFSEENQQFSFTEIQNKYTALLGDVGKENLGDSAVLALNKFRPYFFECRRLKRQYEDAKKVNTIDKTKPVRLFFRPLIEKLKESEGKQVIVNAIVLEGNFYDCMRYYNAYIEAEQQQNKVPILNSELCKNIKIKDWVLEGFRKFNTPKGQIYGVMQDENK